MTVGSKHKHAASIVLKASAICKKVYEGETRRASEVSAKERKTDGRRMSLPR